jgi:GntR family transcriptional regulator
MNETLPVSLYQQVYRCLKERIDAGIYARGAALPSEPKLAEEFGVSLITLRRAVHELVLDGLVERRQGLGSFVRPAGRTLSVGLTSFSADVASGRLRLARTLLRDDFTAATPELAAKLNVQPDSMLRHLVRLDAEGGEPIWVDEAFIPPALAADISTEIASSLLFLSLWQARAAFTAGRIEYEIWVESPRPEDLALLRIEPGAPVLVEAEVIFDADGRPLICVVTRYRGDRCHLRGSGVLQQL